MINLVMICEISKTFSGTKRASFGSSKHEYLFPAEYQELACGIQQKPFGNLKKFTKIKYSM